MYPLLESYPKLNLGKRFTEPLLKVICLSVKIPPFSTASGGGIMFAFIVCWIDRLKKEEPGILRCLFELNLETSNKILILKSISKLLGLNTER